MHIFFKTGTINKRYATAVAGAAPFAYSTSAFINMNIIS